MTKEEIEENKVVQLCYDHLDKFTDIYPKDKNADCDCLEIAEQKAGGQVKNYPCLVSVTEFTKKKSSEIEKICEHLNKNIKCQCDNEIKTGQTSVMCCNICGKPDEDFWNVGEAESMEQGMIEKDLELESLKLYSEETSKRWSQGQQQIKLMRSVIDKLINESKPKYSEAEKLIIKDSIDRPFGKSC